MIKKRKPQKPYIHWRHRKRMRENPSMKAEDILRASLNRANGVPESKQCTILRWLEDTAILTGKLGYVLGKALKHLLMGFKKGYGGTDA